MKKLAVLTIVAAFVAVASFAPTRTSHAFSSGNYAAIDVIFTSNHIALPTSGQVGKAYVNGKLCGEGWMHGASGNVYDVYFLVQSQTINPGCGYPGAPVQLVVNGYVLRDAAPFIATTNNVTTHSTTLVPLPKATFYGTVNTTLGQPAAGTSVSAYINGTLCASGTVFHLTGQAHYTLQPVAASPAPYGKQYCGFQGAKVDFYIGNLKANGQGTWNNHTTMNVFNLFASYGRVSPGR